MLGSFNRKDALWRSSCLTAFWAAALLGTAHSSYAQATPKPHVVTIEAMQFTPATIEVKVGEIVIWKNKDPFPHTVTAENRNFDSGSIAANRSWKFKTNKRGTFPYVCTLHPNMKATLIVK